MAGHSQFKNIMHRKGRQDAIKSKLFGKLAREITVAAKMGTPDPAMKRAVARGDHRGARREYDQGQYRARHQEGDRRRWARITSNPLRGLRTGRVAVIVEVLTDNRNRTRAKCAPLSPERRNLPRPARCPSCSIIWASSNMTRRRQREAMFEAALESGADDVQSNETTHEIYAAQDHFGSVTKALELKFGEPRKSALVWRRRTRSRSMTSRAKKF